MKINYERIKNYQKFILTSSVLSLTEKTDLINLSKKLIERSKANGDVVDFVKIYYPDDCSDLKTFVDFANIMNAHVNIKSTGEVVITGWFQNFENYNE